MAGKTAFLERRRTFHHHGDKPRASCLTTGRPLFTFLKGKRKDKSVGSSHTRSSACSTARASLSSAWSIFFTSTLGASQGVGPLLKIVVPHALPALFEMSASHGILDDVKTKGAPMSIPPENVDASARKSIFTSEKWRPSMF